MSMAESPIRLPEISQYHRDLASLLKTESDPVKRQAFLEQERASADYQNARLEAIYRNNPENPLLTPEQRTILWSHKVIQEYNAMPKKNHAERKRAEYFLDKKIDYALQNQRLETAANIWKARSSEDQSEFYEAIKKTCAERIGKKWREITSTQLGELVKIFAHNSAIADFISPALKGYFRGPEGIRQRVDSMYKFVYGLMDLVFDRKALAAGLKIARFEDEIIPKESSFSRDIGIAGVTVYDDRLLIKAVSINNAIFGMSKLVYPEEAVKDFLKGTNPKIEKRGVHMAKKAIRTIPKDEILARMDDLGILYSEGMGSVRERDADAFLKTWIGRIVYSDDPLGQKFYKELAPLLVDEETRIAAEKEAKKTGEKRIPLSIRKPDGYILDIFLPESFPIDEWRGIMKAALEKANLSEEDRLFLDKDAYSMRINTGFTYKGTEIWAFVRRNAITESKRHELSSLADIGLPLASGDSQKLADEIAKQQIRFLNIRGVRIPLNGRLREWGYTHIDFHKDVDDPRRILAKIFVGDVAYKVRLDRNLNLDLEGKSLDNVAIADSLRFVFLSLLRPILCGERIKDPRLPDIDTEEREVVSRMGHLRWLPEGQRFSKAAVDNYFRVEGKDLFVTNMERFERHNTNRETTYVKPVIEKEENLPPITIHLPNAIKFN